MINYTAIISFKVDIEAEDITDAIRVADNFNQPNLRFEAEYGTGQHLRGLPPVVYLREEEDKQYDSYWRNR
jgi:hypothetical protein